MKAIEDDERGSWNESILNHDLNLAKTPTESCNTVNRALLSRLLRNRENGINANEERA